MSDQIDVSKIDVASLAAKFVKLRDLMKDIEKKHEEELRPYREAREQLEAVFATVLDAHKVKSMKTEGGTIGSTDRDSATLEDPEAFRLFVTQQGAWDLADIRANAKAVREYAEGTNSLPPGVKFTTMRSISVRRPSKT